MGENKFYCFYTEHRARKNYKQVLCLTNWQNCSHHAQAVVLTDVSLECVSLGNRFKRTLCSYCSLFLCYWFLSHGHNVFSAYCITTSLLWLDPDLLFVISDLLLLATGQECCYSGPNQSITNRGPADLCYSLPSTSESHIVLVVNERLHAELSLNIGLIFNRSRARVAF